MYLSTTDEHNAAELDGPPTQVQALHSSFAPADQQRQKLNLPLEAGPPSPNSEAPFSGRSLSPEEKESEKVRLQQLVNSFAKAALRGCKCTHVKESGERNATKYRIDKSLEYLIIESSQGDALADVTCPIGAIQDIYCVMEDGAECFPPEVIHAVKAQEMENLLMVVYRSGQDKILRFYLLEDSAESRDVFLECLRILCIYAQSTPSLK